MHVPSFEIELLQRANVEKLSRLLLMDDVLLIMNWMSADSVPNIGAVVYKTCRKRVEIRFIRLFSRFVFASRFSVRQCCGGVHEDSTSHYEAMDEASVETEFGEGQFQKQRKRTSG